MQPIERWLEAGLQKGEHGVPGEEKVEASAGETARLGPEKCVFIYNANKNKFSENSFENCSIGIHFTAGSEGNAMSGNSFITTAIRLKYVGTRNLDWSVDGAAITGATIPPLISMATALR
ncbi:copper-binding periplasmic protein [Brucella melitensis]|nr:copper-binding periplasmic protein [Brucella melitensis]